MGYAISKSWEGMRLGGVLRSGSWTRALREAESLVQYSSSIQSYRSLVSDEVAGVALAARKLIGVRHPLLSTARRLLSRGEDGIRARGVVVLLASRALNSTLPQPSPDGILQPQRVIAEVAEMIYTSFALHQGILEADQLDSHQIREQKLGNKISVLGGDYLLANSSTALARLGNPQVDLDWEGKE